MEVDTIGMVETRNKNADKHDKIEIIEETVSKNRNARNATMEHKGLRKEFQDRVTSNLVRTKRLGE